MATAARCHDRRTSSPGCEAADAGAAARIGRWRASGAAHDEHDLRALPVDGAAARNSRCSTISKCAPARLRAGSLRQRRLEAHEARDGFEAVGGAGQ